jgi:phosphate uptake regulator
MPRETFQQELDQLVADVIELGAEVASTLESVVEAMISRDAEVVEPELGVDARYKARGAEMQAR